MSDYYRTLNRLRMHMSVIRGAQQDMLNGRPDLDAMEEIAIALDGIDTALRDTKVTL